MIVLCFSGYAKSGKDTACRIIQRHVPHAVRYAFADTLKKEVAYATGVTVNDIESRKDIFREMLQAWGGLKRNLKGADYWPKRVIRKIHNERPKVAVITDLRFPEEAERLKKEFDNVYTIRVEREGITPARNHISDTAMDDYPFDLVVRNDGTLEDFDKLLKSFAQDFGIMPEINRMK